MSPRSGRLVCSAVIVVALLAAGCGDEVGDALGTTTTEASTSSSTTTTDAPSSTSSTTTTSTTSTTTTTTTTVPAPAPTSEGLALADLFELAESLLAELSTAVTVADIETSFRSLADRFAAVADDPAIDPIRDRYAASMTDWADMYATYGPVLESPNPSPAQIQGFTDANAEITEEVSATDEQLFAGLDRVLRDRGTTGAVYRADMLGPIAEYSQLLVELGTLTSLRPSEELEAWDSLLARTGDVRDELAALVPTPRLEELHERQVALMADTEAVFEEFLDLLVAREEPGASLILALGAIQRDGLLLREERGAAVTEELRGEAD